MFFPYRGEIVPQVSKLLGRGARPSPCILGRKRAAFVTTLGSRLDWLLTLGNNGLPMGWGARGSRTWDVLKTVSRSG